MDLNLEKKKENEIIRILDSKYILVEEIGSGSTGKVYSGYDTNEFEKYAFKLIDLEIPENKIAFDNERNCFRTLSHWNHYGIIKYYDVKQGELQIIDKANITKLNKGYIKMDYCAKGNLDQERRPFGEEKVKIMIIPLLKAVELLHNENIVHCDLKLRNLLFDDIDQLKLIDFGCAFKTNVEIPKESTTIGTIAYMSPELINHTSSCNKFTNDIFALGVIIFKLVTGQDPIQKQASTYDPLYKWLYGTNNKQKETFWKMFNELSLTVEFKTLIESMLNSDPELRPSTIYDIIISNWMMKLTTPLTYNEALDKKEDELIENLQSQTFNSKSIISIPNNIVNTMNTMRSILKVNKQKKIIKINK